MAAQGVFTILLVEDNPAIREMVRLVLERHGFLVISAGDSDEAMEAAQGLRIDLLLTDVMLGPGPNGRELADRLRSRFPGLKVLYISGYSEDGFIQREVDAAAALFLAKPFNLEVLARKVNEALDAPLAATR